MDSVLGLVGDGSPKCNRLQYPFPAMCPPRAHIGGGRGVEHRVVRGLAAAARDGWFAESAVWDNVLEETCAVD